MFQPVPGARISSGYLGGFRSSGGHSGIDFAAPAGSPIHAVAPGRVISVGRAGAYGNLVKILHSDGSIGYYAHMKSTNVRPGMTVGRGSVLGRVGSTGNSTGPHLHFEVRRNGAPTNPLSWLDKDYRSSGGSLDPGSYGGVRLDAEQLRNAQTIMRVGYSMGASQRDIIIGLMTAMQESTLRNLDYGDRDSLGLFQQRPSQGWGSPSQVRNPVYAARKFFENLLRLDDRGRMRLTEAAQAVQRSAFPDAYAKWESLARAIAGNPNAGTYSLPDQNFSSVFTTYRDPSEIWKALGQLGFENQGLTPSFGDPASGPGGTGNPADSQVAEPDMDILPEEDSDLPDTENFEDFERQALGGFRAV